MKTLVFRNNNTGCGNIRITHPYYNLTNEYIKDDFMVINKRDNYSILANKYLLEKVDNIVIQNPFNVEENLVLKKLYDIRKQEKLNFRLIYETDDYPTGSPVYNYSCIIGQDKIILENINYFDHFILSTDYLKKIFIEKYKIDENKISVFKNYVFREFMYSDIKFEPKEEFTKRRKRILIAGSSSHFNRSKKLKGDYLDNVIELMHFIIKSDDYELCLIGTVPFFLYEYFNIPKKEYNTVFEAFDNSLGITIKDEYKKSFKLIKWTNYTNYFNLLKEINPDFLLASLKENDFNKCKSWIKQIEAYALPKTVFIGNVFDDCPYEDQADLSTMFTEKMSVNDLKNILTIGKDYKWFYDTVKLQKDYLKDNKLFFEDHIKEYYKILENK